jgi:hypothetical protein
MPAKPSGAVRDEMDRLHDKAPFAYAELSLAVDGCGGIFGGAMDAAFALGADAMVHLPIDAEFEKLDLNKTREMGAKIAGAPPVLVLGDYVPKRLGEGGREEEHWTKKLIGEFARCQIAHYGLGEVFNQIGLSQVRTEFWGLNRAFYTKVAEVYPYDPVPFFAIFAWKNQCEVSRADLGTFYEDAGGPQPWRVLWQLARMDDQLAWAYLRESLKSGPPNQRDNRKECEQRVLEGKRKVFDAMAQISKKLGIPYYRPES